MEATSLESNMENQESEVLFRKFTGACREAGDQGDEMDKIMNKVNNNYFLLNVGYKRSKEFKRLLNRNIERLASDPSGMYTYILEVCKEMKSRRTVLQSTSGEPKAKRSKPCNGTSTETPPSRDSQPSTSRDSQPSTSRDSQPSTSQDSQPSTSRNSQPSTSRDSQDTANSHQTNSQDNDGSNSDTENEEDLKKRRLIKKLNRQLASCAKHIQKLETAEVDWDDDGDSNYIILQTWRDRAVKIYKKLIQYTGEKDKSSYRIHLTNLDNTSRFPEVDRCIRKFVNSTGEFPDFQDILKIYNEYNVKDQLNLTPIQVHTAAADIFQLIGNELQRKRKLDNWDLHCEYLNDRPDPADDDPDLTNHLEDNRKKFITKVNQIVDEFAQKQKEQKLEPVEVTEEDAKSEDDNSDAEEEQSGRDEKNSESETENNDEDATADDKRSDCTSDTEPPESNEIPSALGLTRLEHPSAVDPVAQTLLLTSGVCEEDESRNRDATSNDDLSTRPASKDNDFQVCILHNIVT